MLNAMSSGRYIPGSSVIHRADPRTKIVLTLIFILMVFLFTSYLSLTLLLLFSFGMARHAGKPLQHFVRGLKPIIYLAAFTVVMHIFSGGGTPLAESGILSHISRGGVERSLKMILRLILLVSGTSLLTCTTTPLTLTDGLEWLLRPLRRVGVPVSDLALMMSISLRFIPLIAEEAERIVKVHSSRSVGLASVGLLQRAKIYSPLLMPLFAGVIRRGDALSTAMDARCFGACPERTRMRPLRFCLQT